MAEVKAITDFADTKTMEMIDAIKAGLLVTIGAEVDDAYMGELKKLVLHQDAIDKYGKDLKIVYTPLHGTGNIPARRILSDLGFEKVYVVPEQELRMVTSQQLSTQIRKQRKHSPLLLILQRK